MERIIPLSPHYFMNNVDQLWDNALLEIEINVSRANFSTWFKNTRILKEENGLLYISVPNEFVKEWLSNKYHKLILKSLRDRSDQVRNIEYIVTRHDIKAHEQFEKGVISGLKTELPLKDLYVNKDDNLNPRYSFETFVVGPFNELAYASAQAIIRKPGYIYNPLFIYGGTGLGKTHLLQAIGNYIKKEFSDKKIFYVTSEKFQLDYVSAVQTNKTSTFKEKYRKYDVLIMDDIQFLTGKQGTQEELFHLFNTLYDYNKQIIFSSDKHYSYIPDLEDRLRSRFGAGMIVDIQQPSFESRMALLRAKAQLNNFLCPEEALEIIASSSTGSIREMEGILTSIMCQYQLKHRDLTVNEIKTLLRSAEKPKKNTSIEELVKIVSDFYNIDKEVIYQKTRTKEVVKPRQVIMYLLREDFAVSYPFIGQKLGGRDHTTVIHSCEKIKLNIKNDMILVRELEQIRSML